MKKNKNNPLKPERTDQFPHWPDLFHCSHAPSGSCFHQLDYQLIQKPADQAAKEAAKQRKSEAACQSSGNSTATVVGSR